MERWRREKHKLGIRTEDGDVVCFMVDGPGFDRRSSIVELAPEMADLIMDVAASGVELEDSRMSYVVVQIDTRTWERIKKLRSDLLKKVK